MNKWFLILLATAGVAHASTPEETKRNIRRLADRIYDEVAQTKVSAEDLKLVEMNLRDNLLVLRGELPPKEKYDRGACLKYILDKNFGTVTAKEVCDAITTGTEFQCVSLVVETNYSPRTGLESCRGIKSSQMDCFQDILSRNYAPQKARELCVL